MKIGDKLYQITYPWGKKPDGSYYIFEVFNVYDENHPFGVRVDCWGGSKGRAMFIPEETFVQISDVRKKKFERILNEPF